MQPCPKYDVSILQTQIYFVWNVTTFYKHNDNMLTIKVNDKYKILNISIKYTQLFILRYNIQFSFPPKCQLLQCKFQFCDY